MEETILITFWFRGEEVPDGFTIPGGFFAVDFRGHLFEEGVEVNLCSISVPKNTTALLGGRGGRLGSGVIWDCFIGGLGFLLRGK